MPQVPRYSGTQVREESVPGVRIEPTASTEAFGGGQSLERLNTATRGLNDEVVKLVAREKEAADDAASQEAYGRLVTLKNELIYNPETGALTRKGKNAFGVSDEYGQKYQKLAGEIESSLTNGNQKALFRRMAEKEALELNGTLERHTFVESQAFQENTYKSLVSTLQDDAIKNMDVPGKIDGNMNLITGATMDFARKRGMDATQTKALVTDTVSKTHSAVINRLLTNGRDIEAKTYFDANKDAIVGTDITAVEKVLEEGTLRGESQRQADNIVSTYATRTEALEAAKGIKEPKLRDEVERRVNDHFQQQKLALAEAKESRFKQAADILEQTGTRDRIPPDLWASLDIEERNAIDRRDKQLKTKTKVETEWTTYYELKSMASSPATKDEFLKKNLLTFRHVLADAEFKEIVGLQSSLRSNDDKAEKELDGYRTKKQIVDETLIAAGFDISPKANKSNAEKTAQFRRMVDENVMTLQAQTGKKATNADVQQIVDNLMVKGVTVRGWIWDTTKRAFELKPGESMAIERADIPRTELNKIEDALKRRNIAVTDERIIELYNRKLQGLVNRGR